MTSKIFRYVKEDFNQLLLWSRVQFLIFAVGGILAAFIIGIPTGIIRTTFYTRMTPVLWWNYPVWLVSSLLSGILLASYFNRRVKNLNAENGVATGASGSLLTVFAVGCPICNKLIVMAIGVTGALEWFAPIQPILGIASIGLIAFAVHKRLNISSKCELKY